MILEGCIETLVLICFGRTECGNCRRIGLLKASINILFMKNVSEKLKQVQKDRAKEKAWEALFAARGIFKGKVKPMTDEEWYEWRFKVSEETRKYLDKKFHINQK